MSMENFVRYKMIKDSAREIEDSKLITSFNLTFQLVSFSTMAVRESTV